MKFTLSWLKTFLDTNVSLKKIAASLTMIGLEVEEIIDKELNFDSFEVAEILEVLDHPIKHIKNFKLCEVRTFTGVLQAISRSSNIKKGMKVILLRKENVFTLKNKLKLNKYKELGLEISSIICSEKELNIETSLSLTPELPEEANIGDKITKYIDLSNYDSIIHINVTPNRADSLGVYGVARDLAAAGMGTMKKLEIPHINSSFDSSLEVSVLNQEACSLFAVYELKNLKNTLTPKWIKDLLERIGIRSVSPIVDITNYITHSFGQPIHAYDADKIRGGIKVGKFTTNNKMLALNDKEYQPDINDIVIRDEYEIHSLAGIIGSKKSACSSNTTRIILEAACFNSKDIAYTGRKFMINTDARYRFERYVNKEFTLKALAYATNLILLVCGGDASFPKMIGSNRNEVKKIYFPINLLARKTGLRLKKKEIVSILERLGFKCYNKKGAIEISIPTWRYDISIEEDIVEEIIRIHGYDKIPSVPLPSKEVQKVINREQRRFTDIKRLLAITGYTEVVTWSFMNSKIANFFSEVKKELIIENPISAELDYMRPSILPNLIRTAYNNITRSYKDLSLFELGPIFHATNNNNNSIKSLTAIRTGSNLPRNCHTSTDKVNIFDIKSDLEIIFGYIGCELNTCQIINQAPRYYHPTQSGSIIVNKNTVAYFGQIHPSILKIFNVAQDIIAFEIELSKLPLIKETFGKKPELKVYDYPVVKRDFSFITDEFQAIGEILSFIKNIDSNLIKDVNLVDIYYGRGVEKYRKSITVSITMQNNKKTLTDKEINSISQIIINKLQVNFNTFLRKG